MTRPVLSVRQSPVPAAAIAAIPLAETWIREALYRGVSLQSLATLFEAGRELVDERAGSAGKGN